MRKSQITFHCTQPFTVFMCVRQRKLACLYLLKPQFILQNVAPFYAFRQWNVCTEVNKLTERDVTAMPVALVPNFNGEVTPSPSSE